MIAKARKTRNQMCDSGRNRMATRDPIPAMTVVPIMYAVMSGTKPTAGLMAVPSLSQHLLATSLMRGDAIPPLHALISYSGYNHVTPATPGHLFDVVFNPATGVATFTSLDGLPKRVAEFGQSAGAAVWDFHVSDKVLSPTIRRAHPQGARK